MQVTTNRRHSMAFKIAAVEKSIRSHYTVQSVAKELGICPKLLSRWRVQMVKKPDSPLVSNTGPNLSYTDLEEENRQLHLL